MPVKSTKEKKQSPAKAPAAAIDVPKLEFIDLKSIIPNPLNPRKEFDEESIFELMDSIRKVGVIQPITVRPKGDQYELICGERRYRAAMYVLAGHKNRNTIPASIRNLTDAEAMELMVTENLQRKDVHPLEEADAFRFMMEKMGYQIADIAGKIGKNEPFVHRRLQLLSLVPDVRQIFKNEELPIGHAEVLSRVDEQYQQLWYTDSYSSSYNGGAGTLKDLKWWLNNKAEKKLGDAKFDIEEEFTGEQYFCVKCTICPKNTSVNTTLFPDAPEDARCYGPQCFSAKTNAVFERNLQQAINDPEVILINSSYGGAEPLQKKLAGEGFTVLKYDQFDEVRQPHLNQWHGETDAEYETRAIAAGERYQEELSKSNKAFDIYLGHWCQVKLKITGQAVSGKVEASREILKREIESKKLRGRELDQEKLMKKVVEHIAEMPMLKSQHHTELLEAEINAMAGMCYEKCSGEDIRKALGVERMTYSYDRGPQIMEKIAAAPIGVKLMIIRRGLFSAFNGISPKSMNGGIIFHLANAWCPEDANNLAIEQDEIKTRREAKLDQKLVEFDKQQA